MNPPAFVDSNVLLRHILQDQPEHSSRATELFRATGTGEVILYASETVIFEAVYILVKQFGASKQEVAENLLDLLDLPNFIVPNQSALSAALTYWTEHGGLSFADCFHLALADHWGLGRIYTFDQKMNRYPDVERIEP